MSNQYDYKCHPTADQHHDVFLQGNTALFCACIFGESGSLAQFGTRARVN